MILPEIKNVKIIRKKMGLTLKQFASKCNLEVSWIQQVESKRIKDPSYLKMKKIFDMFESEKYGMQKTAGEMCVKKEKMISFKIGDLLDDANNIMREKGISQIPVFKKNICIGMVTDNVIMKMIGKNISGITIHPKMLDVVPPSVNVKMPIHALLGILNSFEYVLVEKNGKNYGILVRQDLNQLFGKL
jgi:predicted transcriptional regulator